MIFKKKKVGLRFVFIFLFLINSVIYSKHIDFKGQLSGWSLFSEWYKNFQIGLRYIPELSLEKTISDKFSIDTELSLNLYSTLLYGSRDDACTESRMKPYRIWARLSTSHLEVRVGLQKISFGSATLLRPLMWFDRIDPRDPLQITNGVYGLLFRYYFLNNANIWLWGLIGNDETRGWDVVVSDCSNPEYGGRIQYPLPRGEIAVSYHHRKIDTERSIDYLLKSMGIGSDPLVKGLLPDIPRSYNEDRLGIDGKWDVEVGIWVEMSFVRSDIDFSFMRYQKMICTGIDYTFMLGNGLHVLAEHLINEMSERFFSSGESHHFSAAEADYPIGFLDSVTGIIFYDWENSQWYRFIMWKRTYDKLSIFLMGFWNPDRFQIDQMKYGGNLITGKGIQLMLAYNH